MSVLNVTPETLQRMKTMYAPYRKEKTPPHAIFAALVNGVTITAYHSGKVLFQGANSDEEANKWQSTPSTVSTSQQKKDSPLPKGFSDWSVIGSDETGTGSYFGSVVVCAAYVPKEQLDTLARLGVQDSKNLSDKRIEDLALQLMERIPYSVHVVNPEKYNHIQPTMSQGKMKAILHNYALCKLLKQIQPIQPDALLIDQFELPSTYFKHVQDEKAIVKDKLYFATKGESHHLAVACASIIARYTFVADLNNLSNKMGMLLPSGAGSQVDQVAARLINEKGADCLKQCAKWHFANTEKALRLAGK